MLKKICIVATGLVYGGAETQLVSLALELKRRGWNVEIISMLPPQAYTDDLRNAGIFVHSLNMKRGVPDPRALIKLVEILKNLQPDVVHAHCVHANYLARLARIFCHIPVLVCTAHSVNEGGRLREIFYRATDFLCDMTTQVSQSGMDRYIHVGAVSPGKIQFIPNGVSVDRFFPDLGAHHEVRQELELGNAFVWIAVGRFEHEKDHQKLIHAFAKTRETNKQSFLILVGDGTLRSACEQLVYSLGISDYVRFLGIRKDIPRLMNAADAFVMSSKWEGMPIVLLEAASTGLPIVATKVGGIPEVVVHDETGYLVPSKNFMDLTAAMNKFMTMPAQQLQLMGSNGRDFVQSKYSLSAVVHSWEELYSDILNKKVH